MAEEERKMTSKAERDIKLEPISHKSKRIAKPINKDRLERNKKQLKLCRLISKILDDLDLSL